MSWQTSEKITNQLVATTTSGEVVTLSQTVDRTKKFFKIHQINARITMTTLFEAIGVICKSSTDITLLGKLIELFDYANKAMFPSTSLLSKELGISKTNINNLIKRACDDGLFHKFDRGQYFLNPFIILSTKLSSAGYEAQESAQSEWLRVTSLITKSDLDALIALNQHVKLPSPLPIAEYTIDIARYFSKHGSITDRQYQALLKFI